MSGEQAENSIETAAAESREISEKDSVSQFIESLAALAGPEKARLYLRATPRGLFVQKEFLPEVVQYYQRWFKEKTQRSGELSAQKCLKRFFRSPALVLYYLVEAKQCMVGHLIQRDLPQPQRLGLPVYLGTVDDTRRILHVRDPLLLCMPHVEVFQEAGKQAFRLSAARGKWTFTVEVLREFIRLCQRSPRLAAEFPAQGGALRDGFRLLIGVLEKARPAGKQQRLLIPISCRNRPRVNYLCHGSLTFVVEDRGKIAACYEVGARTLFRFVKAEFAALFARPGERRRGILEILPPRNRQLASLSVRGKKFLLSPQAFSQFLRSVMHQPLEHSKMAEKYTVAECLEAFSNLFQCSEPIDRSKISRHVEKIRCRSPRYLVSGRWIFVTDRKNTIAACVDRFHSKR